MLNKGGPCSLSTIALSLDRLRSTLSEILLERLAIRSGFKQRSSKITPCMFLDLVLYCASLNSGKYSLSQVGSYSFGTFGVCISKQSIDNRFNDSAQSFVLSVLSHLVKNYIGLPLEPSYFQHFQRVRIKDLTKFILPDALYSHYRGLGGGSGTSRAGVSIQFEYDLKTSSVTSLTLTDATRNDATDASETLEDILPGDFIIRDLGYCSLKVIDGIKRRDAFFLLRLMPSVAVFDHEGKEVDFKKIYQKMKRYDIPQMEMEVSIGARDRIGVRLSISLASEEVYQRRLDRLKKANERRKDNISESSKNRLRLNLFITNVPQDVLAANDMQDLYRIRWQIELIFKQWKSTCGINKIPEMKVNRYLCILYAKLILILLYSAIIHTLTVYFYNSKKRLLSPHKCMKTLWHDFELIRGLVWKEKRTRKVQSLKILTDKLAMGHWLEKKKDKLSYIDLFERFTDEKILVTLK